jgi:hypothetical protein
MSGVIAALRRRPATFVPLLRHTLLVGRAVPGFAKCSASGLATRAKWKITHQWLTVLPDWGDSFGHPQEKRHYQKR